MGRSRAGDFVVYRGLAEFHASHFGDANSGAAAWNKHAWMNQGLPLLEQFRTARFLSHATVLGRLQARGCARTGSGAFGGQGAPGRGAGLRSSTGGRTTGVLRGRTSNRVRANQNFRRSTKASVQFSNHLNRQRATAIQDLGHASATAQVWF